MAKSKFTIEGEIENNAQTVFKENKNQKTKSNALFIVLIVAVITFFATTAYFFIKYNNLSNTSKQMNEKIKKADRLFQENQAYKEANDTLQKKILKLRHENDILAENNDSADGVFFEVQIGNFSEFNIDAYIKELRNLRQEKAENGNKLCIGRFRSYRKALLFESDIKKMGFTNAFLVGRINGKLVNFQTALAEYRRLYEQ
ncbi:MAG: hypothetical protein HUU47_01865 [Bacteroidetes bacterium]|nr:hypothetical protein [Bacteroidota bacterium]